MKIMRTAAAACIIPLTLSLAACGSSSEPAAEKSSPSTQASSPAAQASPSSASGGDVQAKDTGSTSPQGNHMLKINEPAGLTAGPDKKKFLDFTVKKVTPDFTCPDANASAPTNGHFVAVEIAVDTGDQAAFDQAFKDSGLKQVMLGNPAWTFIDKSGKTIDTITTPGTKRCIPVTQYISNVGPSEKKEGLVVLDVPSTEGSLVLEDFSSGNKWEIEIPKK